MITVTIDTSGLDSLINSLGAAIAPTPEGIDKLTRELATTQQAEMAVRVHQRGEDSDNAPIGTYSENYMKVRTGKWKYKGVRYNRTASTDVVLSLTRQMENDLSVIALPDGYGVGYKNPDNYRKSQEVQDRYKKPIWEQSEAEQNLTREIAIKYIEDAVSR